MASAKLPINLHLPKIARLQQHEHKAHVAYGDRTMPKPSIVPPALPGEPAPPFLAHNATATTLALGWSTAADTGAPIVAYALHGAEIGAPLKPIYDPLLAGRPADADARSYVVRGLRPSTRYAFRVRAATDTGWSAFSRAAEFETASPAIRVSAVAPLAGPFSGSVQHGKAEIFDDT